MIIHCASLTEIWQIQKSVPQLNVFRRDLMNEGYVKTHKVAIPTFDGADITSCESYAHKILLHAQTH